MKEVFEAYLKECPLVAILRGVLPEEVTAVTDVLYESGIRLLEIPLNSPDACKSIAICASHCGERQLVGAGTVLTEKEVEQVYAAGGRFIISPNTNPAVIRRTRELAMLSIPGMFTASEGFEALNSGADYLKLFPACLGPAYVKDLKAVIKAPIMAVGGVNADNLSSFLKVCVGVGIGSALYKAGKSLEQIREDAEKMVAITKN